MQLNNENSNQIFFLKAKKLLNEASIAYIRALILYLWYKENTSNVNHSDWHGMIEALQHCFELSLKAMWYSVGLNYPLNHNPANDIEEMKRRLFMILPVLRNNELFGDWEKWVKTKGKDMEKVHNVSIYGDEKTGKTASESFTEKDVIETFDEANLVYEMAYQQLLSIGKRLNLLTEKEEEELHLRLQNIELIKKQGLSNKFDDFVRSKFTR